MKIAMLFPGYGSQFVGMCKEFYDEHRIVQEYFEQASSCLDINFVKLCFASSDTELSLMRNAYAATFVVSASIAALLQSKGITPDAVAGFNQGEYAALFAAGGWQLPDGLYLLNKFAGFYQDLLKDIQMQAVSITGFDAESVKKMCAQINKHETEEISIALYETEYQHIVTGLAKKIGSFCDIVQQQSKDRKNICRPINLAVGLHSPLMNPVIDRYRMYLEKIDFHDLGVCMLESLNGECIERGAKTKERVLQRINSPVVWVKVMESLISYDLILQIGPGKQLVSWVSDMYPDKKVMAINKPEDMHTLETLYNS